jgi:hypothetical protein
MDRLDQSDAPPSPNPTPAARPLPAADPAEAETVEKASPLTVAKVPAADPAESTGGSLASAILPDDGDDEPTTSDRILQPLQTRTMTAAPMGTSAEATGGVTDGLGVAVDKCTGPSQPGSCRASLKAALGGVGGAIGELLSSSSLDE